MIKIITAPTIFLTSGIYTAAPRTKHIIINQNTYMNLPIRQWLTHFRASTPMTSPATFNGPLCYSGRAEIVAYREPPVFSIGKLASKRLGFFFFNLAGVHAFVDGIDAFFHWVDYKSRASLVCNAFSPIQNGLRRILGGSRTPTQRQQRDHQRRTQPMTHYASPISVERI